MSSFLKHSSIFLSLALSSLSSPIEVHIYPSTTLPSKANRTLGKRAEPSDYPWADPNDPIHAIIENEFKWFGWDKDNEEDKRDGQKIHQAFREWHEFARAGASDMDFESARFRRWFRGGKEDPVPGPQGVKKTFELMIDPSTGVAGSNIAKMVNHRDKIAPGASGTCKAKPGMNAYTIPESGKFHFCRKGIDLPLNSELKCEDFDVSVSGKMKSVSMTFLHETTHYDEIDGTDFAILDDGGNSASKCFEADGEVKIQNAQNYTWFAADAYWSGKCNKVFQNPPPGTTDNEDAVNIPEDLPGGPTKALTIVAETALIGAFTGTVFGGWQTTQWQFFATDYGKAIGCRTDTVKEEEAQEDPSKQLFPLGVYDFQLFGEACQYRNNGHTPGRLLCGDKDIECTVDPGSQNPPSPNPGENGNYQCGGDKIRQPMFTCPY